MRITLTLLALAGLVTMTGCANGPLLSGSGNIVSQEFSVSDFDRVEIDGAWDASITVGETRSVVVHTDDNLMEHVSVDVDGNQLKIDLTRSWVSGTTSISISVPQLDRLDVNGAADVVIKGLHGNEFTADLGGASTVVIDGAVNNLEIDANGALTVAAIGQSDSADLEINGAANIDLSGWTTDSASVDINGASDVVLTGAKSVSGSINGTGDLTVNRDAFIDVRTSGVSDVHRR